MAAPWRTAWITGASTGIGRALAVALAERGVKVAASARSADKLAELARAHPGIAPLPLDVLDAAAMTEAVRSIAGTLGPIDAELCQRDPFARFYAESPVKHAVEQPVESPGRERRRTAKAMRNFNNWTVHGY